MRKIEGHYEYKIYLLRSLVNWRILLELFTNLEADLVCLQGHLCRISLLTQLLSLYKSTYLKCKVPYIPLFDNLDGWARICQHLPVHLLINRYSPIFLISFQLYKTYLYISYRNSPGFLISFSAALQNLPDHPWYAHGCKVFVHTLALLMLKNPNCLVHLDYESKKLSWKDLHFTFTFETVILYTLGFSDSKNAPYMTNS